MTEVSRDGILPPMSTRRIATAVAACAMAVGILNSPAALADPDALNAWSSVDLAVGAEDGPAWRVTMAANGQGVVFSGDRYRDYDASSGGWGAWKRLHTDPERLYAQGNARGDVCTAWSADFGAAIACRGSNTQRFVKTSISTSIYATVEELAISSDGRRALIIWRDTADNRSREYASVYSLSTRKISTTRLRGIPGGAPLQYYPVAARVGRTSGFALAYRTGEEGTRGNATFYRTFRPGKGWRPQARLRLGTPAQDVVISDLTSDGRRVYASVTPDIPLTPADHPSMWWITELKFNGAFTAPESVDATLFWPVIGSSSTSVHIASFDPANRELVVAGSGDFIDSPIVITRVPSPDVADTTGRVSDVSIVGQRYGNGNDGFTVVVQYTGVSNPGQDSQENVDQLFSVAGEDGEALSSLRRLGTKSGYEGMGTKLAGYGQYVFAAYASDMRLYAAAKTPAPF